MVVDRLEALSSNLWWAWTPALREWFASLGAEGASVPPEVAAWFRQDEGRAARLSSQQIDQLGEWEGKLEAYLARTDTWWATTGERDSGDLKGPIVYMSAEFGLDASLPIYSGGLGVLAGDHVKTASDLGLPFVAVGLLYRSGYFRQIIDHEGVQHALYPRLRLAQTGLKLAFDEPIEVPIGGGLKADVYKLDVGRVPLLLLDTDRDDNPSELRDLSARLYGGDELMRIQQEILLGVGGLRAVRRFCGAPSVLHLNEGHCAFAAVDLLGEHLRAGLELEKAATEVRERCVFTTHTPVPAGHDRFSPALVAAECSEWLKEAGVDLETALALGRADGLDALSLPEPNESEEAASTEAHDPEQDETDTELPETDQEPLCMTVLGLRLARSTNGVSMLHGEVSRAMWAGMWPDRAASDVPIGHVTNGIHVPTWMDGVARRFIEDRRGDAWLDQRDDPDFWMELLENVDDAALWALRSSLKNALCERVAAQTSSFDCGPIELDPGKLTLGFARRFATYKRATLLFDDLERAEALFDSGLQLLVSGKAHPKDAGGQALIRSLWELSQSEAFRGRLVVLPGYDMELGRMLVSGVDVWLNNPRRPREASGTSGQKVALHAGLNCSILDGWWPEGFDGANGFAIGDSVPGVEPEDQDKRDSEALYKVLGETIVPMYYERDEAGLPKRWLRRVRMAMATTTWRYSAQRMVKDYVRLVYAKQHGGKV